MVSLFVIQFNTTYNLKLFNNHYYKVNVGEVELHGTYNVDACFHACIFIISINRKYFKFGTVPFFVDGLRLVPRLTSEFCLHCQVLVLHRALV